MVLRFIYATTPPFLKEGLRVKMIALGKLVNTLMFPILIFKLEKQTNISYPFGRHFFDDGGAVVGACKES